jgi:regulatory protein
MATSAYEYALNLLGARGYSIRNLRRKLDQKGFATEEATAAIARLQDRGYLDDEKFAQEFARQRLVAGGASTRRVEQDLVRRGISPAVAKVAVASVVQEEGVEFGESIERLARKKAASLGDLDDATRRRRVFGFLARKGYDIDDINSAMSRIFP